MSVCTPNKRGSLSPPSSPLTPINSSPPNSPTKDLQQAEPSIPDSEPEYELRPTRTSNRHKRPRLSTQHDNNSLNSLPPQTSDPHFSPRGDAPLQVNSPPSIRNPPAPIEPTAEELNSVETQPSEPTTQSSNKSHQLTTQSDAAEVAQGEGLMGPSGGVATAEGPSQHKPAPISPLKQRIKPQQQLSPTQDAPSSRTLSSKPPSPQPASPTTLEPPSRSQIENRPPTPIHPHPPADADLADAFPLPLFSQSQPNLVSVDSGSGVGENDDSGVYVHGFSDEADGEGEDQAKSVLSPPAAEDDTGSEPELAVDGEEVLLTVEEEDVVGGVDEDEVMSAVGDEEAILPLSPSQSSQSPVWLSDITPAILPPTSELLQPEPATSAPTDTVSALELPPADAIEIDVPGEELELAVPPSSEGMDYGDDIWAEMDTMEWTGTQQDNQAAGLDGDAVEPFPDATPAPAFVDPGAMAMPAFVSAKGKAINLSKAALEKAAALLAATEDDDAAATAQAARASAEDDHATPVSRRVAAAVGLPGPSQAGGDSAIPATVSFATGRGGTLAALSAKSIAASKKLLELASPPKGKAAEGQPDLERTPAPFVRSTLGTSGAAGVGIGSPAPRGSGALSGLASGSGRAVAGPSAAAVAKATAMLGEASSSPPRMESVEVPVLAAGALADSTGPAPRLGFTSGLGDPVPGPSQARRDRSDKLMSEGEGEGKQDVFGSETPSRMTRSQGVKALGVAAAGSPVSRSRAASPETNRVHQLTAATPKPAAIAPHTATPSAFQPASLSSPTAPKTAGIAPVIQPTPLSKPGAGFNSPALSRVNSTGTPSRYPTFRPPLGPRAPGSVTRTPGGPATGLSTPKGAPTPRRLNTDMNKRTRPNTLQKFSTPFKNGARPEGLTVAGTGTAGRKFSGGVGPGAAAGTGRALPKGVKAEKVAQLFDPVFDLTPRVARTELSDAGFKPQGFFVEQLQECGVPDEAIYMTAVSAVSYIFEDGRSEKDALSAMHAAGCSLATDVWVRNHWSLIVWKLAATVRSKPDLLGAYWSFEAALDQLLYRYERETNQAERSAIKRVQEQDSPATLSMVLCIAQILWDDPLDVDMGAVEAGNEPPQIIVGLELTDGWYRIRAGIDDTLRSACQRGKIVVGSKLVVCAAKLEASREGTDVLQALSKSSLVIAGNSTTLAPWHAKLGFTGQVFAVGLESITPEGGTIPLLDVVIENVFPLGYCEFGKNAERGNWSGAEEKEKKEAWEKGRERLRAKMVDEAEKEKLEYDELFEMLQEAVARCGGGGREPVSSQGSESAAEEPDEVFDRLESTDNKAPILAQLSPYQLRGCLALAAERVEQSRQQAAVDLEAELDDHFPRRDVRPFRVVRVRDARGGGRPLQHGRPRRTAQLSVWGAEAEELGEGFLVVGKRYLVGAVVAKGAWARRAEEIMLKTVKGTRWQLFEE